MATSVARRGSAKIIPVAEAKKRVLAGIASGLKVAEACATVQRSQETYRDWAKTDPEFKAQLADLRQGLALSKETGRMPVPDFETFCRDYLFEPLFPHQLNMFDVIEGRAPRALDPAMVYEAGTNGRVLINLPPNHAKTVTVATNYVVWQIHRDPNVKIAIISKGMGYAKKILAGVKMRLTSNAYRDMHLTFAPEGGWRDIDQSWTQNLIYVQGKNDGEKDPTVEAVGLGGQIYGGRFDIVICDDLLDNENHHRHVDQVHWLMTIVSSRLPPDGGKLIVVGTRMAPVDMYSELRQSKDDDEKQFFTYLSMPAVLDYGDGDKDTWKPLWPYTNCRDGEEGEERCIHCYGLSPCECASPAPMLCKVRWNGSRLAKHRFSPLGERGWSLIWQQQSIPSDATFDHRAIECSINHARKPGVMSDVGMGHRAGGMNGLYVVGGLDPATVGHTAMMVVGLDRATEKRWYLDGYNRAGTSPQTMRDTVKRLTDMYGINEWVIERNAFQRFLTQDPELNTFLRQRGVRLTEHYTNAEKRDVDFGVMSMAPLFLTCGKQPEGNFGGARWMRTPETALIELPATKTSQVFTDLIKQLITWEPAGLSALQKTDLVMAAWFTEIAFQRILGYGRQQITHVPNRFATRQQLSSRRVIDLVAARAEMASQVS